MKSERRERLEMEGCIQVMLHVVVAAALHHQKTGRGPGGSTVEDAVIFAAEIDYKIDSIRSDYFFPCFTYQYNYLVEGRGIERTRIVN